MNVLLLAVVLVQAPTALNTTPRPGFRAAPPIFQQNCGTCHDGKQAPSITDLQDNSPEKIYEVLTTGKMKDQATQVPDVQKRQIAEFLAGRPMGSDEAGDFKKMANACSANPPMSDPATGPAWNGWSPGLNQPGGGVAAVKLSDGSRPWTAKLATAGPGNPAATSAIPGVVFTGSSDGNLRALSTSDGQVLWQYNTARDYESVNGITAKGGNMGQAGATVAAGMVFVGSGYGTGNAGFGNVLLAFGPE